MKKFFKLVSLFSVILLAAASLFGCDFLNFFDDSQTGADYTYVTLSINPAVDLVVNSNDIVETAIPANEDAEMLLCDEDLAGLTVEGAAQRITELATEAGFIDVDSVSNEVRIEVAGEKEDRAQRIAEKIRKKVNSYFQNNGIFGNARVETFEKYIDKAEELGIDISNITMGKLKAILAALEQNPEIDIEEIIEMSVGDIIRLISERARANNIPPSLIKEFKEDVEELLNGEFAGLKTLREEIRLLRQQIETLEDSEEKEALIMQLEEKVRQYKDLLKEFRKKVEELREEYKQRLQEKKDELKAEKQRRIEENKQKIDEFRNNVKDKIEEIREEVKKKQEEGDFNPFIRNDLRAAFNEAYEKLKEKYAEMFQLKAEIEQLRKQIFNSARFNDSKDLLEALKEKEARYKELYDEFMRELNLIIQNLKNNQTGNADNPPNGQSGGSNDNMTDNHNGGSLTNDA